MYYTILILRVRLYSYTDTKGPLLAVYYSYSPCSYTQLAKAIGTYTLLAVASTIHHVQIYSSKMSEVRMK